MWGRHKEELLKPQREREHNRKLLTVKEKRRTAECWGGEEYLIEWDDGEREWVSKREVERMKGEETDSILKAKELITEVPVTFAENMIDYGIGAEQHSWSITWREFLNYAQRGDRGRSAKENVGIDEQREESCNRETYPTLYPGEVEGENEEGVEGVHQSRNKRELTNRARNNQHRRERRNETHYDKKMRIIEGEDGTRRVSDRPEQRPGGGEWELPPLHADTEARRCIGGLDGRGVQRVLRDEMMNPAHDEKYAGHPILRLFTRPEEMENGKYIRTAKEDVAHMNSASGKKLTYDTLNVAMTLHERHNFHLAVATDGSKKGGSKDRGETQRLSETTYGVWQGPNTAAILKSKRKEATVLQKRLGVTLDQMDKIRGVEQGVLSGRLGDSATAAGAELFAIFAILRKVQAEQDMGHYGNEKARILIMSDCLSGLRILEKIWRGGKRKYRKLQNGAVLEAITNVREKLGTVIFMWIPSHVGIIPNVLVDNIAAQDQEVVQGMDTGLISKQEGDGTHRTGGHPDISGS
eukprot:6213759-Pleurochrysis_carterae.AAC.1